MSDQSTELAGPDFSKGEPMIVVQRVLSYSRDGKELAVAVRGRDRADLRGEVEFERALAAAGG